MAARSSLLALAVLLIAPALALAEEATATPPPANVFQRDPHDCRYLAWWRPTSVVFDEAAVSKIQRQIDAIPADKAATIPMDAAFGPEGASEFLMPVLAANGQKGAILLGRRLEAYKGGGKLDDPWLLAVASLGRMPNATAQTLLEAELARVSKEYDFTRPQQVGGRIIGFPMTDARVAIADALLACLAAQGKLAATDVENLRMAFPRKEWLMWTAGLEWARAYMPEAALDRLILDGLALCDASDLATAVSVEPPTARVRAIRDFLIWPPEHRPMAHRLAVQEASHDTPVSRFLLVNCTGALVADAQASGGTFTLDVDMAKALAAAKAGSCRGLSINCKILLGCRPSQPHPEWMEFLKKHAALTDPKDELYVAFMIEKIHANQGAAGQTSQNKSGGAADPKDPVPGVRMVGFKAPPEK